MDEAVTVASDGVMSAAGVAKEKVRDAADSVGLPLPLKSRAELEAERRAQEEAEAAERRKHKILGIF